MAKTLPQISLTDAQYARVARIPTRNPCITPNPTKGEPTMSFMTASTIAASSTMRQRVAACAASEGVDDPETWAYTHSFRWAASPGWDAKWESALAGDPDADPGMNEAAITDADILSTVQAILNPAPKKK